MTSIVLEQIPDVVGAQAASVVRVVLVGDEGVAVVPIEAILGGEPHEAPAVLQDCHDTALREAIVRGEVCESEVCDQSSGAETGDEVGGAALGGRGICSAQGRRTMDAAEEKDPARAHQRAPPSCVSHINHQALGSDLHPSGRLTPDLRHAHVFCLPASAVRLVAAEHGRVTRTSAVLCLSAFVLTRLSSAA